MAAKKKPVVRRDPARRRPAEPKKPAAEKPPKPKVTRKGGKFLLGKPDDTPRAANGRPLKENEQRFAQIYVLNGFNASQAMVDAGYSPKTAEKKCTDMVKRCRPYILWLQENQNIPAVTPTTVKDEMRKLAFSNLDDYLKEDPARPGVFVFKSPKELTRDQLAAVESFTMKFTANGMEYEYKLYNKRNSLMDYAKVLHMVDSRFHLTMMQADKIEVNYRLEDLSDDDLQEMQMFWEKKMSNAAKRKGQTVDGEFEER